MATYGGGVGTPSTIAIDQTVTRTNSGGTTTTVVYSVPSNAYFIGYFDLTVSYTNAGANDLEAVVEIDGVEFLKITDAGATPGTNDSDTFTGTLNIGASTDITAICRILSTSGLSDSVSVRMKIFGTQFQL